jgi:ABC-type multidrug transport system fused ATPase/permease subunit
MVYGIMLYVPLMQMEMAFFDTNKVGDISSRLSSDTTAVSDQVSCTMIQFSSMINSRHHFLPSH